MSKPTLFNKVSIIIFSILITSLGGALMFAFNLRAVGKNKIVWPMVIVVIIGSAVIRKLTQIMLPGTLYQLVIPGAASGLVLAFPAWDKYLSEYVEFQPKSILVPVIVTIVLWGGLLLLNLFLSK